MKAIFNDEIIELDHIKLSKSNRGFRYGDGLFETIVFLKGKPRLLIDHLQRMEHGATVMKIDNSGFLKASKITNLIHALIKENSNPESAIIRIYLWRESAGLYTPETNNGSYIMTANDATFDTYRKVKNVGFSTDSINFPSKWSSIKSISALNYVMAGIEKKERNLEELIITDYRGNISEGLSSNIFWKKGQNYYTPSLNTGCIEGVMRNWFIASLKKMNQSITETEAKKQDLLDASCIFTTNATGITHIQSIDHIQFKVDDTAQQLIESIS